MKRLLLIRHAKSSWKFPELIDHDRPLNKRGRRDSVFMAKHIAGLEKNLSIIFSSTAVRALELAETIGEATKTSVIKKRSLYTFNHEDVLSFINRLSNSYSTVSIVTHNPAATILANELSGNEFANVPTSGIVAIDCESSDWSQLSSETCRLDYFHYPKLIRP